MSSSSAAAAAAAALNSSKGKPSAGSLKRESGSSSSSSSNNNNNNDNDDDDDDDKNADSKRSTTGTTSSWQLVRSCAGGVPNVPMDTREQVGRELLFLVAEFLERATPCRESAATLRRELTKFGMLPQTTDWRGRVHQASFAEMQQNAFRLPHTHVVDIVDHMLHLTQELPSGSSSGSDGSNNTSNTNNSSDAGGGADDVFATGDGTRASSAGVRQEHQANAKFPAAGTLQDGTVTQLAHSSSDANSVSLLSLPAHAQTRHAVVAKQAQQAYLNRLVRVQDLGEQRRNKQREADANRSFPHISFAPAAGAAASNSTSSSPFADLPWTVQPRANGVPVGPCLHFCVLECVYTSATSFTGVGTGGAAVNRNSGNSCSQGSGGGGDRRGGSGAVGSPGRNGRGGGSSSLARTAGGWRCGPLAVYGLPAWHGQFHSDPAARHLPNLHPSGQAQSGPALFAAGPAPGKLITLLGTASRQVVAAGEAAGAAGAATGSSRPEGGRTRFELRAVEWAVQGEPRTPSDADARRDDPSAAIDCPPKLTGMRRRRGGITDSDRRRVVQIRACGSATEIARLRATVEAWKQSHDDAQAAVHRLTQEMASLQREIALMRAANDRPVGIPTETAGRGRRGRPQRGFLTSLLDRTRQVRQVDSCSVAAF